mmetsp:Transcript_1776/g.5492  ORF Transcript_1776/g.5492 Transcript_1776/m.5492 type:complete len:250 (-) Transcript_1776:348-1097(-)
MPSVHWPWSLATHCSRGSCGSGRGADARWSSADSPRRVPSARVSSSRAMCTFPMCPRSSSSIAPVRASSSRNTSVTSQSRRGTRLHHIACSPACRQLSTSCGRTRANSPVAGCRKHAPAACTPFCARLCDSLGTRGARTRWRAVADTTHFPGRWGQPTSWHGPHSAVAIDQAPPHCARLACGWRVRYHHPTRAIDGRASPRHSPDFSTGLGPMCCRRLDRARLLYCLRDAARCAARGTSPLGPRCRVGL